MKVLSAHTISELSELLRIHGVDFHDDFFQSVDNWCQMAIGCTHGSSPLEVENQKALRDMICAYKSLSSSDQEVVAQHIFITYVVPWHRAIESLSDPEVATAVKQNLCESWPWNEKLKDRDMVTPAEKLLAVFEGMTRYENEDYVSKRRGKTEGLRLLFSGMYAGFVQTLHVTPPVADNGIFFDFMNILMETPLLKEAGLQVKQIKDQIEFARDHYRDPQEFTRGAE